MLKFMILLKDLVLNSKNADSLPKHVYNNLIQVVWTLIYRQIEA